MSVLNILIVNTLYCLFTIIKFFRGKEFNKINWLLYYKLNKYYIYNLVLTFTNLVCLLFYNNIIFKFINLISFLFGVFYYIKQIIVWNKNNNLKIYNFSALNVDFLIILITFLIIFKSYINVTIGFQKLDKVTTIQHFLNLFLIKIFYLQLIIFYISAIFYSFIPIDKNFKKNENVMNEIFYDYVNKNFRELNIAFIILILLIIFFIIY